MCCLSNDRKYLFNSLEGQGQERFFSETEIPNLGLRSGMCPPQRTAYTAAWWSHAAWPGTALHQDSVQRRQEEAERWGLIIRAMGEAET